MDISKLDLGSDSIDEWGWGGLPEFSGKIADIVTRRKKRKSREENNLQNI